MRGIRTFIVSAALCVAAQAQAVWMPLDAGNVWVYREAGMNAQGTLVLKVERVARQGGKDYSLVSGLPDGLVWLRNEADGRIMTWDEGSEVERVWLDTAAAVGSSSATKVDPCNATSMVVSREAKYSGPVGDFSNAMHIRYTVAGCADAGVDSDYMLPWVGFVRRTYTTIAGPRSFDLVYAKLGAATMISGPEQSFGVSIDKQVYVANMMPPVDPRRAAPVASVRMTLRNTTGAPLQLQYASGQMFDMALWNEQGQRVWRWSEGKAFTQAMRSETIDRGERVWSEQVPLAFSGAGGAVLPEGRYVLEVWLTTTLGRTFTASVPLKIEYVR